MGRRAKRQRSKARPHRRAPEAAARGIRSFIAIELEEAARGAAAGVVDALRRQPDGDAVRWIRAESLHVTLRFLGNVEPEILPELAGAVAREACEVPAFELRLGPVHAFPSSRRPRVVALSLEPLEPLRELAAAVERGVVAAGLEPEARPFRAHLTLGRIRGRFALPDAVPDPDPSPSEVREIVLFRSDLEPSGARHTPLEWIPLEASFTPKPPGGD